MQIRIDTYFDLTCDECCRSWSTDFDGHKMQDNRFGNGGMGMATDKKWLRRTAHKKGWRCSGGKTLWNAILMKSKDRTLS